jgi:hypothetical protein
MERTVRFGDLVRDAGRPEPVTLWTAPEADSSFSKAIRENRVLTVFQDPASNRKDFGRIGFHREPGATYFVFPRPLPDKQDARIVGVNYQLIEEPKIARPSPSQAIPPKPQHKRTEEKPKPKLEEGRKLTPAEKPTPNLAEEPKPKSKAKPTPKLEEKPKAKVEPVLRKFEVLVRRTAVLNETLPIEAATKQEARRQALDHLKTATADFSKAQVTEKIITVR